MRLHILILTFFIGTSAGGAAVLDPGDFSSLGSLTPSTSVVIDTGASPPTITVDGGPALNGVVDSSSSVDLAVFTFSIITLADSVSVTVSGNIGLAMLSKSTLTVAANITLSGNNGTTGPGGAGGPGADDGGAGGDTDFEQGDGQGAGSATGGNGGGGGAAYGGDGGRGGRKKMTPGTAYGDDDLNRAFGGSGGANGNGNASGGGGGGGGGFIELVAVNGLTITSTANIDVSGGAGGNGDAVVEEGGGGGSGGGILLAGYTVTLSGNVDVSGGAGGNPGAGDTQRAGGGGGGGRVAIFSTDDFDSAGDDQLETSLAGVNISGGAAGTPNTSGNDAHPGNTGTLWDGSAPSFAKPPSFATPPRGGTVFVVW